MSRAQGPESLLGAPWLANRLALRLSEAAQVLGISERTLRTLTPELPHVRRGGVLLYPVDALRDWLNQQAKAEKASAEAIADEIIESMAK
jgi:hypothetical protein